MANTKIPVELSSTPGIVDNSNATAITIDSSENVGIGTTSPTRKLSILGTGSEYINIVGGTTSGVGLLLGDSNAEINAAIICDNSTDSLSFRTGGNNTRMTIDSSGNVGIGTNNPAEKLDVNGNVVMGAVGRWTTSTNIFKSTVSGENGASIRSAVSQQANPTYSNVDDTNTGMFFPAADKLGFSTGGSEKMRIDSEVQFFKSNGSVATAGVFIQSSGRYLGTTNSNVEPMILNRQDNDGGLIEFRQANSNEGTISVSGSTVSYNGFSGTHETSGISTDTEIGTVCSTIDELDTYTSGTKEGQTRADHAKIKISDTVGDTRVYGVLASYSETDNKPIVASVGIGSVKVTGTCSGGDLLESNGDGTAKVQSDDIVRSKTIGKVAIGNSDTGVKLVSCVLYCG